MNVIKKREALRFFNEAAEYIDKFETQDLLNEEDTNFLRFISNNSAFLRDEMINELNNLRELLRNNPDLKIKALNKNEREIFYDFIKFYRICPLCGNPNHFFNLKKIYFDEDKKPLIEDLIRLMHLNKKKLKKFKLQFGLPCCNCYKLLLEE